MLMEDFPFFQTQDDQFSANGMYFPLEGVDSTPLLFDTKDDFQTMLFDWQDQEGSFQDTLCEDFDLKIKTEPPGVDFDSPILTNALTSQIPLKIEQGFDTRRSHGGEKILFPGDVEPIQISSSIQTDNVLKRITQARSMLINGEKEILGKNIIGLHCLNEIKTSPDQNCQITSTVINGRRIKIIIRPKSGRVNQEASKCLTDNPPLNKLIQPTDELISQLQDGDYDVLGHEDGLDSWTLPLHPESDEEAKTDIILPPADPPRVPPLRIKIPKKEKKRKAKKEDFGEFVPLDHDYCSYKRRQSEFVLMEKNPRKDSGLESGGVSDASEEGAASTPNTPLSPLTTAPDLAQQLTTKLLEEKRRSKNHSSVTKMATALFRASNAATSNIAIKIKTECVVNETTHNELSPICDNTSQEPGNAPDTNTDGSNERPKKKLKLEEYRNRQKDDLIKKCPKPDIKIDTPTEIKIDENLVAKKPERKRHDSEKRCSSSSAEWNNRRRHRNRSRSRNRGRKYWTPRRSRSRDSSSSSGSPIRTRSSSARYRRRSRSRSRSAYRTNRRRSSYGYLKQRRCRSRSPFYNLREKHRQIEERRVVYVGRILEGTTNQQLRKRFSAFGPIADISVHFRERGDNYGFVTFEYKEDAYDAVEHGNDDDSLPRYDLCFGGRRSFCKQRYSDLDGMLTSLSEYQEMRELPPVAPVNDSFDLLLKQAKAKLHQRRDDT